MNTLLYLFAYKDLFVFLQRLNFSFAVSIWILVKQLKGFCKRRILSSFYALQHILQK